MDNNLLKKIYSSYGHLSPEQVRELIKDREALNKLKDLENIEQQSSFDFDAIQGYTSMEIKESDLDRLNNRMQNVLNHKRQGGNFFRMFLFVWSFSFILIILFSHNLNSRKSQGFITNELVFPKDNSTIQSAGSMETNKDVQKIEERFIISNTSTVKHANTGKSEELVSLTEKKYEDRDLALLNKLKKHTEISLLENPSVSRIKKPWAKEIAINDYIFIDYRGIRSGSIAEEFDFSGTPANRANKILDLPEEELKNDPNQMAYHEFLKETAKFIYNQNYYRSEQNLRLILKTYPEDLNANFYLGYVLFQTGKIEEALQFFSKCGNIFYGNFNEEAQWYSLKCYQKLGKTDMAMQIAQEIIDSNGFYYSQAKDFLKSIRSNHKVR
jgi:tetratricopeptide (TPR) repeat protein